MHPLPPFAALFGHPPAVTASAPGRVNLIGEHTDYNGGFVLPTPIARRTHIELTSRSDRAVRLASDAVDGHVLDYELGQETAGRGWLDYAQGVTHTLATEGFAISGFDALIASDVPLGSGLSSSASFTVALIRALRAAFDLSLDDVRLALLARRVENEFVGAPVGVMDPMAVSLGEPGVALFLDTRDLVVERVPIPSAVEVVVIDSAVRHRLAAGGGYGARRAECERATALLGVTQLRNLDPGDLSRAATLPPPLDRRVRHVVTENARVLAAVAALRADDPVCLGALFAASHASMRDDFEVSIPEIDLLVALAGREPDVFGARLTGGGFGGSIVMIARRGEGRAAARRVAEAYRRETGREASII